MKNFFKFIFLFTLFVPSVTFAKVSLFQIETARFLYGASSSYCYNYLNQTTYDSGFATTDFSNLNSVKVINGKIVLNTDNKALSDPNRIIIGTKQRLQIKYVYESADQAQTLGWFVWDNRVSQFTYPYGYTYTDRPCNNNSDCESGESCRWCSTCTPNRVCAYPRYRLKDTGVSGTGAYNGVYDWFEKLYTKPGGTTNVYTVPLLLSPMPTWKINNGGIYADDIMWQYDKTHWNSTNFNDGGTYKHISNYLEYLVSTGGGWIYLLTDDDTDTQTTVTCNYFCRYLGGWWPYCSKQCIHWQTNSLYLPPIKDNYGSFNGVPDYDVDGNGSVNSDDRTVDLGTFDAGTEIIFFLNSYYRNDYARYESVGMKRGSAYQPRVRTFTMPYFTKAVLNPDYQSTGTHSRTLDIGCSYTPITWNWSGGHAHTCGGVMGWLDQAALDRLNTAAYNFLYMPHETKTFYTIDRGQRQHVVIGAPSTDPTRWILGFEQLYDGGSDGEDGVWNDYNDAVFMIIRQNGGEAVSDIVSTGIPASQLSNSTITKVHLKKDDYIPSSCPPPPDTRIEYYISVNVDSAGEPIWIKVEFPAGSDEVTIDLAALGYTGAYLRWKVEIISPNEQCQPEVHDLDIGYQALRGGDYNFSTALPIANVMFKGTLETPTSTWTVTGNDTRNRGHFYLYEIYDPQDPNTTAISKKWDAGSKLSTRNPDSRVIYTQQGTSRLRFNASSPPSWLYQEVLSNADRAVKNNGKSVYDLNGDNFSNDQDALQIIKWTTGWEYPKGSSSSSVQKRAWPLGAIHRSTAAIITPPGTPLWLQGSGIPGTIKSSYITWKNHPDRKNRDTVAVVGAQDGMLHAFYAGKFKHGDDPSTPQTEQRGYFQKTGATRDYGTGSELWAWIPPSQLNNLKNNYVQTYYPETHPWAQVDGSVALEDVLFSSRGWTTAVFYNHGTVHPYLSSLDVTDPTNPRTMWDHDWTDNKFNGTYAPPAVIWMNSSKYGGQGKTWAVVTTSGISDSYGDVYLFLIDVDTGNTLPYGKVKMNIGGGNQGAQSRGVWGSPVAIDVDGDGYYDRIYFADSNGRVWKHNLDGSNNNQCLVADVGPEGIYVTPTLKVAKDISTGQRVVTFYFGTSDHPDENDTVNPPYHFYAFVDADQGTNCSVSQLIYDYPLPPDEKVWADAFISGDEVYVGTSTGDKADICDENLSNPGHIYTFSLDADTNGLPIQSSPPVSAGGNVVSGILVYDEHLFINSLGGKSKILGANKWNNTSSSGAASSGVEDVYWKEY